MNPLDKVVLAARERGYEVHHAPAKPPAMAARLYLDWLAAGMHAGMKYLERDPEQRVDPTRRFPWLRGVLVLGLSYAYPEPDRPLGGLRAGKVARYAWARDYHLRIEPHLRELEAMCAQLGGICRGYVDHGPLLERSYAAAGGGGWVGRNGLWLTQSGGSYHHLAVLLTSWETGPFSQHPHRCGGCTACVHSCPTGAIVADGVVDARRCIGYWTAEHRGPIPVGFWSGIGNWLFGCDDCQLVCPWNRKALAAQPSPDPELAWPNLDNFFSMSNRAFAKYYAGSAFVRSGRPVLARNALIVLSNAYPDALLDVLPVALEDPSALVRQTAAVAAARIGRRDWVQKVLRGLTSREREYVLSALDLLE